MCRPYACFKSFFHALLGARERLGAQECEMRPLPRMYSPDQEFQDQPRPRSKTRSHRMVWKVAWHYLNLNFQSGRGSHYLPDRINVTQTPNGFIVSLLFPVSIQPRHWPMKLHHWDLGQQLGRRDSRAPRSERMMPWAQHCLPCSPFLTSALKGNQNGKG